MYIHVYKINVCHKYAYVHVCKQIQNHVCHKYVHVCKQIPTTCEDHKTMTNMGNLQGWESVGTCASLGAYIPVHIHAHLIDCCAFEVTISLPLSPPGKFVMAYVHVQYTGIYTCQCRSGNFRVKNINISCEIFSWR